MTLRIPKTATNPAEWVRRGAVAINDSINNIIDLTKRVVTLEAFQGTASASLTSLDGRATAVEGRATALETYAHAFFTLTPAVLPGSPVEGMTVYDIADDKVKTWNGTAWQAHY